MAFIATLTENEQNHLYDAIYSYTTLAANIDANMPPPPMRLVQSLSINAIENAYAELNNTGRIVETSRRNGGWNDRYFFLRNNNVAYMISTNNDLSDIYQVSRL